MYAYELLPHLKYLLLSEEDGEIGWIGTDLQWGQVELEINNFENE